MSISSERDGNTNGILEAEADRISEERQALEPYSEQHGPDTWNSDANSCARFPRLPPLPIDENGNTLPEAAAADGDLSMTYAKLPEHIRQPIYSAGELRAAPWMLRRWYDPKYEWNDRKELLFTYEKLYQAYMLENSRRLLAEKGAAEGLQLAEEENRGRVEAVRELAIAEAELQPWRAKPIPLDDSAQSGIHFHEQYSRHQFQQRDAVIATRTSELEEERARNNSLRQALREWQENNYYATEPARIMELEEQNSAVGTGSPQEATLYDSAAAVEKRRKEEDMAVADLAGLPTQAQEIESNLVLQVLRVDLDLLRNDIEKLNVESQRALADFQRLGHEYRGFVGGMERLTKELVEVKAERDYLRENTNSPGLINHKNSRDADNSTARLETALQELRDMTRQRDEMRAERDPAHQVLTNIIDQGGYPNQNQGNVPHQRSNSVSSSDSNGRSVIPDGTEEERAVTYSLQLRNLRMELDRAEALLRTTWQQQDILRVERDEALSVLAQPQRGHETQSNELREQLGSVQRERDTSPVQYDESPQKQEESEDNGFQQSQRSETAQNDNPGRQLHDALNERDLARSEADVLRKQRNELMERLDSLQEGNRDCGSESQGASERPLPVPERSRETILAATRAELAQVRTDLFLMTAERDILQRILNQQEQTIQNHPGEIARAISALQIERENLQDERDNLLEESQQLRILTTVLRNGRNEVLLAGEEYRPSEQPLRDERENNTLTQGLDEDEIQEHADRIQQLEMAFSYAVDEVPGLEEARNRLPTEVVRQDGRQMGANGEITGELEGLFEGGSLALEPSAPPTPPPQSTAPINRGRQRQRKKTITERLANPTTGNRLSARLRSSRKDPDPDPLLAESKLMKEEAHITGMKRKAAAGVADDRGTTMSKKRKK